MTDHESCPTCGQRRAFATTIGGESATVKDTMRCANGHQWTATYKLDRKSGEYRVVSAERRREPTLRVQESDSELR